MAINLRETATALQEKNPGLTVFLDEVQGEQDALSVYFGAEEVNTYVDVLLESEGAEFWHEGTKRKTANSTNPAALADEILAWLEV